MKKFIYYTVLLMMIAGIHSCGDIDNYDGPSSTLKGSVIDEGTDSTVQTEVGSGGIRVKLLETSYSSNPTAEYFQCMEDGTFNNTKIFAATYKVSVEGPFVPIVQTDASGNVIADSRQTVQLKKSATLNFKVQPFLRIEWVSKPVFNPDTTVTVKVKISRGTDNPNYQVNITDVNLYVANTRYVANNDYDPRYSVLNPISALNDPVLIKQYTDYILSNVITLTTKGGALPAQDVYFRVGARISSGLNEYNYSTPVGIKYP